MGLDLLHTYEYEYVDVAKLMGRPARNRKKGKRSAGGGKNSFPSKLVGVVVNFFRDHSGYRNVSFSYDELKGRCLYIWYLLSIHLHVGSNDNGIVQNSIKLRRGLL